jgi:hypothetical protein
MLKLQRKRNPNNVLTEEEVKVARLAEHIGNKISWDDRRRNELDEEEKTIYLLYTFYGAYVSLGMAEFLLSTMAPLRGEIELALERLGTLETLNALRVCGKVVLGSSDPGWEEFESLSDDEQWKRRDEASEIGDDFSIVHEFRDGLDTLILKHFSARGYELAD